MTKYKHAYICLPTNNCVSNINKTNKNKNDLTEKERFKKAIELAETLMALEPDQMKSIINQAKKLNPNPPPT